MLFSDTAFVCLTSVKMWNFDFFWRGGGGELNCFLLWAFVMENLNKGNMNKMCTFCLTFSLHSAVLIFEVCTEANRCFLPENGGCLLQEGSELLPWWNLVVGVLFRNEGWIDRLT